MGCWRSRAWALPTTTLCLALPWLKWELGGHKQRRSKKDSTLNLSKNAECQLRKTDGVSSQKRCGCGASTGVYLCKLGKGHSFFGMAGGEWDGFGPLSTSPIPRLGAACPNVGVGLEWGPLRGRSWHPCWGDISYVTCVILMTTSPES